MKTAYITLKFDYDSDQCDQPEKWNWNELIGTNDYNGEITVHDYYEEEDTSPHG